ncbi:MAG: Hpt domain-containing protein, partial [Pseudomonas sp.]|nr:Hpt domain-containing protein [Pseudomonas sp.]
PLAETEALIFDVVEPSSDEVADLQLLDAEPEQSDARETADSFTFELDELEELPALQDEETVAAPLLDAEPELELEELSLDQLAEPAQWDELELADLELPEVELPSAPQVQELPDEPAAEKPLSMADVMAAPVQAINPPAADVPPSLLPPPADEEPVDEELLEVFIEEVGEVLETIGEYLPQWQADTDNKDALIEVRRAFHTLKGSGRMVRALIIGELGWSIENLLNRVLDRSIEPSAAVQQVVLDVVALMPVLVDEFAAKAQRQRDDVDLLAATAHALAKGLAPPKSDAPAAQQVAEPVGVDDATEVVEQVESVTDQPLDSESLNGEPLDPQLLEIFRNEAETHLDTLVGFLADCAQELPQPVTDDLQRALHTLKGSAYMAGILPVAEIAAPLEKLVKEFKTNLIQVDLAAAELLSSAEGLFRAGLDNLESQPLAPIPGAEAFLARVQALHQERLASAEDERQAQSGETRDPQLIGIFLAEGMDILLDAEDLLRKWREHPSERQELSALLEELTTLGRGAEMAELPQIDELCEALLDLYGAGEEGSLAVSERFFDEAEKAHEALIGMMDQVAAALQVSPQPERVQALRELLSEAIDPHTLALLAPGVEGLEIIELEQATAELAQAEAEPVQWQETPAEPAIVED